MNILFITQYYYPDNFLLNDITAELVRMGHRVKVLTGLPDYSTTRIPKEFKWLRRRKENYNGVDIRRVSIIARRSGAIFRMLNYASFAFSASLYALFSGVDTDAIFVYAPSPVFQGIPAMIYKRRTRKKSVHYCFDLWPESLKAWNISERSIIFKAVSKISGAVYRDCDVVAVTSRPFREYLTDVCKVSPDKIAYLPQYAEDLYGEIAGQYEDNSCIDFVFAGNLGSVQDLPVILHAVSLIETEESFCIHIVGDGSELTNLKSLAASLGLENKVIFHGRRPLDEMKDYYRMADCFLLTLRGGDFIGMTLPAKAQGYLCAGKPVAAAIDGAGRELIVQADCGEAVPAGDAEGLAEKMKQIIENMESYKQKGLSGRRFYEQHFTKEIFLHNLMNILA